MNICKSISITFIAIALAISVNGQYSFVDYQKSFVKVADVFRRKEDSLRRQFESKGLQWPAKYVYIRSFKYDSQLEVWVKNSVKESFKLFKTYKICAMAGSLGPKRMQGDYQVPEIFIISINYLVAPMPIARIKLSNASDRCWATLSLGGDIYIHGSCVPGVPSPSTTIRLKTMLLQVMQGRLGRNIFGSYFPIQFNNPEASLSRSFYADVQSYRPLADKLEALTTILKKITGFGSDVK